MTNLINSGLDLRRIKVEELSGLVASLNHNFEQILSLPGFKGVPGAPGTSTQGEVGVRGNEWLFSSANAFIEAYSEISSGAQVTITFMNNVLNENEALLYSTLNVDTLINNDVIVLPSAQVVQLKTDLPDPDNSGQVLPAQFADTGISFAEQAGVTEERVREIVQLLVGGTSSGESIFRGYSAIAKNYADDSPGLNQDINENSVIDIQSAAAGPGPSVPDFMFLGLKESTIPSSTQACLLAGHPNDYHRLIQNTQENFTNDYAPGVNDWAASAILQNSFDNGLLVGFGKGPDASIRDFARLYRTENAFRITSSYSPREYTTGDYSEVLMSDGQIDVRAAARIRLSTTEVDGMSATSVNFRHFNIAGRTVNIGTAADTTENAIITATNVRLVNQTTFDFVSTDSTGKLVKNYTFYNSLNTGASAVLSGKAITDRFSGIVEIIDQNAEAIDDRVTQLENADSSANYVSLPPTVTTGSVNLNSLFRNGTYIIHRTSSLTISNTPFPLAVGERMSILNFANTETSTVTGGSNTITQFATKLIEGSIDARSAYRIGTSTNNGSSYNFSLWYENVSHADDLTVGPGLSIFSRSSAQRTDKSVEFVELISGDALIGHTQKPASVRDISNTAGTAITGIAFDASGHPTGALATQNFDNRYLTQANNLSDVEDAAEALSNLGGIRAADTYTRVSLYTREQVDALLPGNSSNRQGFPDQWPPWLSPTFRGNRNSSGTLTYSRLEQNILRNVCAGYVSAAGSRQDYWGPRRVGGFPYSVSFNGDNIYTITHNFGRNTYGVAATAFDESGSDNDHRGTIVQSRSFNQFTIRTEVFDNGTDRSGFFFIMYELT